MMQLCTCMAICAARVHIKQPIVNLTFKALCGLK